MPSGGTMWAALLSCVLLLVPTATADDAAGPVYMMHTLGIFKANCPATVCIHLVNVGQPINVTIVLDHDDFQLEYFRNHSPPNGDSFACQQRMVPSVDNAQIALISLTVGNETQRRSVVVNKLPKMCFMKCAKPVYMPGENVTFRVFCLNGTLFPEDETIESFEVRNPWSNLMMQQRNVTMQNKIASFSYPIGSDSLLGWYSATVRTHSGLQAYGSFECKRYVSPTFDTVTSVPSTVNSIDVTMNISVSGRYTIAKPLDATVNISVCRLPNNWEPKQTCNLNPNGICWTYDGKLGPNGTLNLTVGLLPFQMLQKGLQNSITVKSVVTEEGTDVQVTKTDNVWISDWMPRPYPDYEFTDTYYRRRINCTGELLLQDAGGNPMSGEKIELLHEGSLVAVCTTNDQGRCPFSVNTSDFTAAQVSLDIQYDKNSQCFPSSNIGCPYYWGRYPGNQVTFRRYYSPSDSYMRLDWIRGPLTCGTNISITGSVKLNMKRKCLPEDGTVLLAYTSSARGEVKSHGSITITVDSEGRADFSITVAVNSQMVPMWTFTALILLRSGEVVSDRKLISVKPCFQNTVDVRLSAQKVLPGSSVTLTIQTSPNATCCVTAVDKSVEIMTGGNLQSLADEVLNQMPYTYMNALYIDGFFLGVSPTGCTNMRDQLMEGVLYTAVSDGDNAASATEDLQSSGFVIICSKDNTKKVACPKPNYCPEPTPTPFYPEMGGGPFATSAGPSLDMAKANAGAATAVVESLRANFAEIMFDHIVQSNSNGEAILTAYASDSITTFNIYGYCNSDSEGFGVLSTSVTLEIFQKFYTQPNLPECAVRKESFMFTATAYMYKEKCSEVDMWLHNSTNFTASLIGVENGGCICENERTTSSWNFTAIEAGNINVTLTALATPSSNCDGESDDIQYKDTVIELLTVVFEGVPQEKNENFMICTKGGNVSQPLNLTLPGNVVEGSASIVVTCVPDPVGICMQNLENLVQMPAGCVQENLALLKIVAMLYAYKNDTGTLTTEDDIKMRVWMTNLWSNFLRFYSWSGCFTTWSSYYPIFDPGFGCNFWFTTEAMSCLYQIKDLIYLEDTMINQMKSYIASQQNLTTGAFPVSGPSTDPHLESEVACTAQVVFAYYNAGEDASDPVTSLALTYLLGQAGSLEEPFEMAMACVALATAGDVESAKGLKEKLMGQTVQNGDWKFLPDGVSDPTAPSSWTRASSSMIMLNSVFAKCCLLVGGDISQVAPIMSFISRQMGRNGQFGFSVVTAMAQEVLLMYGKLTNVQNGSNQVVITTNGNPVDRISVDQTNRFVVQEAEVPVASDNAQIEVSGSGCLFILCTRKFTVKTENKQNQFILTVVTTPRTCDNGSPRSVELTITVSYMKSNASNMAIMNIKSPTGYRFDISQLDQMTQQATIQQYYLYPVGHCRIYINSVTREPMTLTLTLLRITLAQNLSTCYVYVYDAYNGDDYAMKEYTAACSQPPSTAASAMNEYTTACSQPPSAA